MNITKSHWGWRYLAVGVISCLFIAAIAGREQHPALVTLLSMVVLTVYVALWELHALITAKESKGWLIASASAAAVVCIVVLMAASDALITGNFRLLPERPAGWAFPLAMVVPLVLALVKAHRQKPSG